MGFSEEWEERYRENTQMSRWPWSDLVSLIMRYGRPNKKNFKVLELGCGVGANIPLFESLGVDYYSVEGSSTAVQQIHQQYPQLKNNVCLGDFTLSLPDGEFDLIVDRASLTSNHEQSIRNSLKNCYKQLVKGGKFIGVDWYSTEYSDYLNGEPAEDCWTRKHFTDGYFARAGRVHFSDKEHLLDLFNNFKMLTMDHKRYKRVLPDDGWELASWNFVAEK